MHRNLRVIAGLVVLFACGCGSSKEATAAGDMCSHCAGTQGVTAKGTCDACGMAVDVCHACTGEQTLTAEGNCSGCGAKVAVKA